MEHVLEQAVVQIFIDHVSTQQVFFYFLGLEVLRISLKCIA
jgi:hypothetical protein